MKEAEEQLSLKLRFRMFRIGGVWAFSFLTSDLVLIYLPILPFSRMIDSLDFLPRLTPTVPFSMTASTLQSIGYGETATLFLVVEAPLGWEGVISLTMSWIGKT